MMENEYFNTDFEPIETSQDVSFEGSQDDDWAATGTETEHVQYSGDDTWLNEEPLTNESSSYSPNDTDVSDSEWTTADVSSIGSQQAEDGQVQYTPFKGSAISFTGFGKCECGCASFGGHGNICSYCGHPYSAHSRY